MGRRADNMRLVVEAEAEVGAVVGVGAEAMVRTVRLHESLMSLMLCPPNLLRSQTQPPVLLHQQRPLLHCLSRTTRRAASPTRSLMARQR